MSGGVSSDVLLGFVVKRARASHPVVLLQVRRGGDDGPVALEAVSHFGDGFTNELVGSVIEERTGLR